MKRKMSVCTHVAKLQKLFVDLNGELKKHNENTLSERMLNGRILSTLGKEYDNFKDLWDTIPTDQQKLNLLIEELCSIELREINMESTVSANATAFAASKNNGKKKHFDRGKENSGKIERNKCKQMGHWAAECSQKKNAETASTSKGKPAVSDFLAHIMEASTSETIDMDSWCCDSGASRHITLCKQNFVSYAEFQAPEIVSLGKRKMTMEAYGQGTIKIQVYHHGRWHDRRMKNVWYVPNASVNLFSVKAVAQNGFSVLLDGKGVQVREGHTGSLVATGYLNNELYLMKMRDVKPNQDVQVNLTFVTDTLQVFHERFAHQNKRHVKQILKRMDIDVASANEELCDGCMLGKMHRLPFKRRENRATQVGELIHADVNGPMSKNSLGGSRYYVCFTDDFSKFRRIFFLKRKNEVCGVLKQFLNEAITNGHPIKRFRSDGGKEFDNKEVAKVLADKGIEYLMTPPYTPQQNGVAERENRTIVEAARSMLLSTKLSKSLWAEACNTAAYVLNRSGKTAAGDKVPYELWYSRKVGKLDHLRIFGTACYVHIQKQFRSKFSNKSVFGHMVGYVNDKDGYRVWIPSRNKVVCSHDVVFKKEVACNMQADYICIDDKEENSSNEDLSGRNEDVNEDINEEENSNNEEVNSNGNEDEADESFRSLEDDNGEEETELAQEDLNIRRSTRNRTIPNWMNSGEFAWLVEKCTNNQDTSPSTHAETMKSVDCKKWHEAMLEELSSLKENEAWKLVKRPTNKQVIQNRWVRRMKKSDSGMFRFKARLVAKGYAQKEGIDYDETFSPVARYDTVRALLAIAASRGMKLRQFNVKTAFLYGKLQQEVYLEQPEGFEDGTDRVCRLKRSLYGLKQAARCWNERLTRFMEGAGLKKSSTDPCLFYRNSGNSSLYVVVYVDDGLIVGNNEAEIEDFLKLLKGEFKITLGSLKNFLGMQINCMKNGSILINQKEYTEKVLKQFGMDKSNTVSTPANRDESSNSDELEERVPYREAIGSLIYLATATRPDIAFAVGKAARVMDKPERRNWNDVKRIVRYLRGTTDFRISYKRNCEELKTFSDADYAGDLATRRSTTGVLAILAGGAITWRSQL